MSQHELRCLHLFHLWQVGERNKPGLPKHIQKLCREAFVQTIDTHDHHSNFHDQINKVLEALGLNYINEYRSKSGYSIDIKVEMPNNLGKVSAVYIECDGPYHYMSKNQYDATFHFFKGGKEQNLDTILKHRLVPAFDKVPLISIPYFEWNAIGNKKTKRQQYLQKLLGMESINQ